MSETFDKTADGVKFTPGMKLYMVSDSVEFSEEESNGRA